MSGKRSKQIRKQVYGDSYSPRDRRYKANVRLKERLVEGVKQVFKKATIFDAGLRAVYQRTKRNYNKKRKNS